MPPMRTFSNWNSRSPKSEEQIEPYRKYFFICEGANTECYYFKHLIDNRKILGLHPLIDIRYVEKENPGDSYVGKLIDTADKLKEDKTISFVKSHDQIIIVFDYDIFQGYENSKFNELFKGKDEYIKAISNPKFELFLLLHFENTYEDKIKNNEQKILSRDKVEGQKRYIDIALIPYIDGINPKKNIDIGKVAAKINIAIEQEKLINQDITKCENNVTCNIGQVIEMIKADTCK